MNETATAPDVEATAGGADGPYPGLRPFLPRERDIFFGREQMIDQVLVRLNERHMVVVHGASGCGKSSLVAAGVLPQLAQRRARRELVLRTGTFRPGAKPMQALIETLQGLCGIEGAAASLEDVYCAISNGAEARANVARLAAQAGVDQLCIVVDQFEELFRFAEEESFEEARQFAELLVQLSGCGHGEAAWWEEERAPAAPTDAEVSFILTMRSEFLGNCARYPGLAEAINDTQYLLPNMTRPDLIRAIREPADVFGGSAEHQLAERMADDALHEEDSLPLVQHALQQLWRESKDGALTLADYEQAIETCTACARARKRNPLGAILAAHADKVLAEVATDETKRAAAEFIFRALTKKDSESRAIRCPQKFSRLVKISGASDDPDRAEEETRAIIDAFRREGASFLTPYASIKKRLEDNDKIDISHEALIRTWPQMSDQAIDQETVPIGWIEREAQAAMMWRWISVQADLFRTNPQAYLDLATNKRLVKWFERIRPRPEWARRHLVKPADKEDITEEPEWQAVEHLLTESFRKTRLDRLLVRWSKAGGLLFTLALIGLIIVLVFYIYWERQNAAQLRAQHQEMQQQVDATVQASERALSVANTRARNAPAATAEIVDERIAAAATAAGSFINTPNGQGYVWIGAIGPGPRQDINLIGAGNLSILPNKAHPESDYWIARHTIVRRAAPNAGATPDSVGIIARGTLVRVLDLSPGIPAGERTDYWARVRLAQTGLPVVHFAFANVPDQIRRQMRAQLTNIGYQRRTGSAPAVDTAGHAEVVYCHQSDRAAAVQLATTITRWIAQHTLTRDLTVTPLRGDTCDGIAPRELMLVLDLAPPPTDSPAAL